MSAVPADILLSGVSVLPCLKRATMHRDASLLHTLLWVCQLRWANKKNGATDTATICTELIISCLLRYDHERVEHAPVKADVNQTCWLYHCPV